MAELLYGSEADWDFFVSVMDVMCGTSGDDVCIAAIFSMTAQH